MGGTLLVVHVLSAQKASSHTDQNIEQTAFKISNLSWNQQALQTWDTALLLHELWEKHAINPHVLFSPVAETEKWAVTW